MSRRRRSVIITTFVMLGIGIAAVLLVFFMQRSVVFHPDPSPVGSASDVLEGGHDLALHTEDGLELSAWLFPADSSVDREMAVLYAPGNAGNRQARTGIAEQLTARGFTVLLMEYRGYGGNPGSPTEEGLALDAVAAAEALVEEGFSPERTLYLGESLGTGVVAHLQSTNPPAGVLLRTPFPDFAAVANEQYGPLPVGMLLRDRFPTLDYVRESEVPMTVVHGTADTIVPSPLSAEVADAVGNLHDEIVLDGVGHNDPEMFGEPVADALADLADHVDDPAREA